MLRPIIRWLKMSINDEQVKLTQQEMLNKKIEMDGLEDKVQKIRARIYQIRRELKDGFKRKRY
jgi:predicted ATP-grasp superfamily ATP-dependent carboligase